MNTINKQQQFYKTNPLDGFDGDIDEVENLFHEYMDNVPKNVILI